MKTTLVQLTANIFYKESKHLKGALMEFNEAELNLFKGQIQEAPEGAKLTKKEEAAPKKAAPKNRAEFEEAIANKFAENETEPDEETKVALSEMKNAELKEFLADESNFQAE